MFKNGPLYIATVVKYITVFCINVTHAAQSCGPSAANVPARAGQERSGPSRIFGHVSQFISEIAASAIGPWSGPRLSEFCSRAGQENGSAELGLRVGNFVQL